MSMLKKMLDRILNKGEVPVGEGSVLQNQHTIGEESRVVGLTDAVRSGWYQSETGELVNGFKIVPEDIVLDVGCGDGLATHFSARQGSHVIFTDVDPVKIEGVRKLVSGLGARKLEGIVSDTDPLPLSDEYATKILAMEMLEHTEDPQQVLRELVRVGQPGAQYLISVPDSRSEIVQKPIAAESYFQKPNHIQIFDKDQFISLVESSGLQIEAYKTTGFYWTIWWCLNWIEGKENAEGPVLDSVPLAKNEILKHWACVWNSFLSHPGAADLIAKLNDALPKSQAVVARKP